MKENTSSAHDEFLFGKSLGLKVSEGKSEITIERKEGTKEKKKESNKTRRNNFPTEEGKTAPSNLQWCSVSEYQSTKEQNSKS